MAIRSAYALLPVVTLLAACGPSPQSATAEVEISRPWARATAAGLETGGVFLTIRNRGGSSDRLVGGSSPAAQSVEIHAMSMDGAVMRMRQQQAVDIPAATSVELAPGGTHLMLVGLKAPLNQGKTVPVSLEFEKAGRKTVEVRVRAIGSTGPRDDDND